MSFWRREPRQYYVEWALLSLSSISNRYSFRRVLLPPGKVPKYDQHFTRIGPSEYPVT